MKPQIAIAKIHDQEVASTVLLEFAEQRRQEVCDRAYHHFQQRGETPGNDWEDWLRAEREVLWKPHAEMFENSHTIVLRVAVPGFERQSIQLTATPRALLVQGDAVHQHDGLEARLHFCEFGRQLFRIFDLPKRIDPYTVSATLDKGILEIVANIARPPRGE